jgi:hypothetical protein
MKALRTKYRGLLASNVPQNEMERHVFEDMGYEELPTGQWYRPDRQLPRLPELVEKYPYIHNCRSCRRRFGSKKYHDAFCGSCRDTMAATQQQIESILNTSSDGTEEAQFALIGKITEILECPYCLWQGNEGRYQPKIIALIRECLPDWIAASHGHQMRHIYWNRFPRSLRFERTEHWDSQEKAERSMQFLKDYFKKNPPIFEIAASVGSKPGRS